MRIEWLEWKHIAQLWTYFSLVYWIFLSLSVKLPFIILLTRLYFSLKKTYIYKCSLRFCVPILYPTWHLFIPESLFLQSKSHEVTNISLCPVKYLPDRKLLQMNSLLLILWWNKYFMLRLNVLKRGILKNISPLKPSGNFMSQLC